MVKTLTFAVMHFTVAFSVTYLITGSFLVGGLVATVEPAINTVAYYFHEKLWQRMTPDKRASLKLSLHSVFNTYALKSS